MNSASLDASSGTINGQPSLALISLDSGGVINEQSSLPQIPNPYSNNPVNNQPTTVHTPGQRTTNPSLAPPSVPPTAEKEQFSCAEILAGMQVAKEDESIQQKQQKTDKRGRPRKNPEAPPKAKRPRGRPRKDGKPPVQRKEKDRAAEMLLMLYQQGPNSSFDPPRNYRKVINVGGVKAIASGANMTTRQGSRHGEKSDSKGSDKGGMVIDTNTTKVFKGISTAQQEAVSLLVTGRRNAQLSAPAPLPASQPGSLSYKTATIKDLPPLQEQPQKVEGSAPRGLPVMRKSKTVDNVTNSIMTQQRIFRAIQAINNRYGPPGAERNKKLADVTARGITLRPSQKWQAQLYYARKSRYIGVFDDREKAALAYEVAREILKTQDRCGMDLGAHYADDDVEKIKEEIGIARKAASWGIRAAEM